MAVSSVGTGSKSPELIPSEMLRVRYPSNFWRYFFTLPAQMSCGSFSLAGQALATNLIGDFFGDVVLEFDEFLDLTEG